jgi:WD40 repeat protein
MVRLWDLSVKDPSAKPMLLRGHEGAVEAVAISQSNHWIATGSADNTVRLWDLSAKDPAINPGVLRGHEDAVNQVEISPDNRCIVTASASNDTGDNTARLWDLGAKDPGADPRVLVATMRSFWRWQSAPIAVGL